HNFYDRRAFIDRQQCLVLKCLLVSFAFVLPSPGPPLAQGGKDFLISQRLAGFMPAMYFICRRIEVSIAHPAALRARDPGAMCRGIPQFWNNTVQKARALTRCARTSSFR